MFTLEVHSKISKCRISAGREGRALVVRVDGRLLGFANSTHDAGRIALEHCATILPRESQTNGTWGLLVVTDEVSALFGEPMPGSQYQTSGGRARKDSAVARIHRVWDRDGRWSADAMRAALKVIEAYCNKSERKAA